jgi:hypothetical protein
VANNDSTVSQVKADLNALECSPSQHASNSSYGGKPSIKMHKGGKPGAKGSKATDGFKAKPPGYKGGFGSVEQV